MFANKKSWNLKSTTDVQQGKDAVEWSSKISLTENDKSNKQKNAGMNIWVTAFFLVAQMAGAGFLALPKGFAYTGWLGLAMLFVFGVSVAYSGTRLGQCWVILEERWPEYREPARQPYMEIASRAFGKIGRNIAMAGVLITLVGSSIVFIILIAQFLESLINGVSMCIIAVIVGLALIPLTWLGTPKDFWQASVLAVVATLIACLVICTQLILDRDSFPVPEYRNPTVASFSLGFGTILFSFGGASVFPTIQNDMTDKSLFWKSVVIGFIALIMMYLPVAVTGYALLGSDVPSNILLYSGHNMTVAVEIAIVCQVINLIATYLIVFNPVCQIFEEMLNVPRSFGWKRIVLRSSIVLIEMVVGLAFPDFGLIMNLIGGSSITLCSFLLPGLMYMRLASDRSEKQWLQRTLPAWEKIFLWEIVIVGAVGGLSAIGSAILAIIETPMSSSCFSKFFS